MENDLMQQQIQAFKAEQEIFEQAKTRYLQACREFQPFNAQKLPPPPLTRAAYSDRMAWILAVMASLAYIFFEERPEERARLEFSLASGQFELVQTFNNADTQAFLAKNESYAVLSFRGTQSKSIRDVNTDLQLYRRATKAGEVHAGFDEAYEAVSKEIVDTLNQTEKLPLYITGHSLGGALATIATQRLEPLLGDQIAACYTFGSPRVGNDEFDKAIKAAFYRIVNVTDIVTLFPILGYSHVGDARYLTRHGELRRGIPTPLRIWEALIATILSLPQVWKPWVGAHNLDEYIEKLNKIALERNKKTLENITPETPYSSQNGSDDKPSQSRTTGAV